MSSLSCVATRGESQMGRHTGRITDGWMLEVQATELKFEPTPTDELLSVESDDNLSRATSDHARGSAKHAKTYVHTLVGVSIQNFQVVA